MLRQISIGIACFVCSLIALYFAYPQFRVAQHHWRQIRTEASMPGEYRHKISRLILAASVCVLSLCCAGFGIFLLVHRPEVKSSASNPSTVSSNIPTQATVPSSPVQASTKTAMPTTPTKPEHRPHKSTAPSSATTTPSTGGINGSDNTQVNDNRPITGNRNTIVGATDGNGNTIINQPGTAIGNGAQAGPNGIAIGAHAGALQPQTVGGVDCGNSANCAGINNGQQIVNQFGPAPMVLTDSQMAAITKSMEKFSGIKVRIFAQNATPDSSDLAKRLAAALREAGLIVEGPYPSSFFFNPPPVPGILISASADRMKAAQDFGNALYGAKFLPNRPDFSSATPAPGTGVFDITVIPNR